MEVQSQVSPKKEKINLFSQTIKPTIKLANKDNVLLTQGQTNELTGQNSMKQIQAHMNFLYSNINRGGSSEQ